MPQRNLVARTAGGKLARTHAHSDDASEEEEEWYDASEDVEEEPPMTTGSWWEQDNVDAADVESHLLKDIQQKGMFLKHSNCYKKWGIDHGHRIWSMLAIKIMPTKM